MHGMIKMTPKDIMNYRKIMEKREEFCKKEWQKPKFKSLKFSQTFGGDWTAHAENDCTVDGLLCGDS